ncbi:hypothetical protein HYX12_02935 [Candidatus Woesearchaeota archaeon]|nr:hypothetical protein [Candidatus Woesearchaeota archaeon]
MKRALLLYLCSFFTYGLAILLVLYLPYYGNTFNPLTKQLLLYLFFSYLIISPGYYFLRTTPYSKNKPYLFLRWIIHIVKRKDIISLAEEKREEKQEEKTAILFLLVKIYFLPLMANFFINNFQSLISIEPLSKHLFSYPVILTFLFTVDTFIFTLGYTFEFKSLKNIVKSVDQTILGWSVALICYPPFNSVVGKYIPWGANDYVIFWNIPSTVILRIIIILLLIIYVWATVALGTKASNLTNRGIVAKFPYSLVRHPAYISKNLIWWITLLPVITWKFALGMAFWSFIYLLRAITEERHLSKDLEYKEYSKKVKWRFIPFIY